MLSSNESDNIGVHIVLNRVGANLALLNFVSDCDDWPSSWNEKQNNKPGAPKSSRNHCTQTVAKALVRFQRKYISCDADLYISFQAFGLQILRLSLKPLK